MKVKIRKAGGKPPTPIEITSEFIRLDALLKFAALVMSGGEAKMLIKDGKISVNGEPCTQRGKKLRPGDSVVLESTEIRIVAAGQAAT